MPVSSAKHILELNFERTWRGGERQTLYNMIGLRNAGMHVDVLCRKGYPLEAKCRESGFRVYAFGNVIQALFFLVFKGYRYRFFHAQTSHILTYCLLSKPFHRAKIIFTRRVDFVPKGWLTKRKYLLTDRVVAISTAIKNIIHSFGIKEVTVISDIVIPQKLNAERANEEIAKISKDGTKYVLGTIAALVPHKDPLTMVEAIRQLSYKRQDFVFLHFGNGELEAAVQAKIEAYNLSHLYIKMGFYEQVEDFFTILNLFVMSSQEEGLGSSVLDAFLYDVPVVGTDAGGLTDLLGDGRGVMCPKQSPEKLAAGIDAALNDPGLRKSITEHAKAYATNFHSMDYITQQYLKLIDGL